MNRQGAKDAKMREPRAELDRLVHVIIKALALMASWRLASIEILDMVSRATALDY